MNFGASLNGFTSGGGYRAQKESLPDRVANQIVDALTYLAQRKIGALIVFPGKQVIDGLL